MSNKVYFGCVPKEQLLGFFNRLKMNLIEGKKNGDKKEFELEIRGTEEDPKGISLEIFNFNKSKYVEYFDFSEEYMKKSLMIFSLNIKIREGKNEEEVKKLLEELYKYVLNKKFAEQFELHFRHKGQKLIIDLILIKGEFIKSLIDLGFDLNKFSDFNLIFNTKLDFNKIFADNIKENEIIIDLFSLLFSIKSSGENIKYLIRAFYEALKDVKLSDYKLQEKYNKIIRFLNFVNSFITSKIKFNFKAENLKNNIKDKHLDQIKALRNLFPQLVKSLLQGFGLDNFFDCEELSFNFGIPKYQDGLSFVFKFPGFTKLFS